MRIEDAALDLASAASHDLAAISVLADAVQSRLTTGPRLAAALARRRRIRRRQLLSAVIEDVRNGTASALEYAYLHRVVRAHGLPRGRRQSPDSGMLRDVELSALGLIVELDGRLFHAGPEAWDADHERDLDAVIGTEAITVRLTWGQVVGRSCHTASKLARLMQRRGWAGAGERCPRCPAEVSFPDYSRGSMSPGGADLRRNA